MRPREPLDFGNERLKRRFVSPKQFSQPTFSSVLSATTIASGNDPLIAWISRWPLDLGLDLVLLRYFPSTHAPNHGHSDSDGTIVLQEARSPPLPLSCHELFLHWILLFTRSLILGPITRNSARRPVARDSNGRYCDSFLDFSAGRFRRSWIRLKASVVRWAVSTVVFCTKFNHKLLISPGLVSSAVSGPNGRCKLRAINTIRLGGEGGKEDTTCAVVSQ